MTYLRLHILSLAFLIGISYLLCLDTPVLGFLVLHTAHRFQASARATLKSLMSVQVDFHDVITQQRDFGGGKTHDPGLSLSLFVHARSLISLGSRNVA